MRRAAGLLVTLLAGCHTAPQVISTGPDTYLAGASSHALWKSDMAVTSLAMKRAEEFCAKQGKRAQMTGRDTTSSRTFSSDSSQLEFVCGAPAAASAPQN